MQVASEWSNRGGIYVVRCANGRYYIGKTCRFSQRMHAHENCLRIGTHRNAAMQRDADDIGLLAFSFEAVAIIEDEEARSLVEHAAIQSAMSDPLCYNVASTPPRSRARREAVAVTKERQRKAPPKTSRAALIRVLDRLACTIVAATAGTSESSVRSWKNGQSRPRHDVARRLERFGIPADGW